jgi:hypothetical protein
MLKKGMLGYFIIPFFGLGLFLGLIGIAIFLYLFARRTISSFLMAKYSLAVDVPLLTASEIFITPSVLNYLGIVLFVMFLFFTFFVLSVMKDRMLGKQSFFNVIFYMTVYTMSQTLFLVVGAWNILIGKKIWGSKK